MVPLTAVAAAVAWFNRSPWWGWALLAVLVVALAVTSKWWLRGRALLQVGAWVIASVLVWATAIVAYPPPQNRQAGGSDPEPSEIVATQEGPVQGVRNDERTVETFAGIPYAQPPVGELRWRAPERPLPRSGLFTADQFSDVPVQSTSTFASRALSRIVEVPLEDTFLNPYPVSEDSLSLNVWRSTEPESPALPVLVYIAGGGFATGSGALPLYDGAGLASRGDVITVTVNYRLGVLGFLSHPELAAESEYGASGNYGILDQIAALEWVRDNIASFGGDPDRVTVAGESAGGESVCILGATPLAEGLVDGIIGGSGACMGTTGDADGGDQTDARATAEEVGQRLTSELDGATIDELRSMPVSRIVDAAGELGAHWQPSVDGYVLERSPAEIYATGEQLDVPTIMGSNADESSLALASPPDTDVDNYAASVRDTYGDDAARFLELYPGETPEQVLDSLMQSETDRVMTRAMYRWAQLQSETVEANAYLYFFSRTPPEQALERYGAYHGAEVMYAYNNLGADGDAQYTDVDYRLRDQMSDYWVQFVSTGDPNVAGAPAWPPVEDSADHVMEFGDSAAMTPRPAPDAIDFWMDYAGPIP